MTDNKFTQADIDAINSFVDLSFYNGWDKDVQDIIFALKPALKMGKYNNVSRPDWQRKCGRDKIEEFGGIFWSWLVLQYGEYGTSPRYGWIGVDNAKEIYNILKDRYDDEMRWREK